jgi:hypothetical protein
MISAEEIVEEGDESALDARNLSRKSGAVNQSF